MNNTAISRNFIRTPKILSFALFVTCYIGFWIMIPWSINLWLTFFLSVGWGLLALCFMDKLADKLTKLRFASWAENVHGIHPDDLDDFLDGLEPDELEKMVATDLEGWDEESEEGLKAFDEVK